MKSYIEIINFVNKSNSVISASEFKKNYIGYYFINKLIKDGYIKKISTGIYSKTDCFDDEFSIIQHRYKKVVFSYNTALYLIGETEVIPNTIEVTVPREYNINSFVINMDIHYIKNEYLLLGAIQIESPYGNTITCYNLERTLCDIIKNESSLDKEQINKIIRNCFFNNKINGTKLLEYAKMLKCERKVKSIMEVMI